MRRTSIVAALFVAACLSTATAKKKELPVYFDSPCTCQNNHMEDRKIAKNDPSTIPTQPSKFIEVTPSKMYGWPPLPGLNDKSRRRPQEQQWYKVTGRVVDVRVQEDGDIHFELQDVTGTKRGIFWQKYRLVVTGVIFGKPFSVGLRKGRGSNASKPLLVYRCRNSRL